MSVFDFCSQDASLHNRQSVEQTQFAREVSTCIGWSLHWFSNSVPFAVNTPTITGVDPNTGGAGTSVTISGSGFGASQGSGVVWLGSTSGNVVSWSDAQVVATVAN